jgi:hypothetical protein
LQRKKAFVILHFKITGETVVLFQAFPDSGQTK